jgi:lipid-A-disaccharide synthase
MSSCLIIAGEKSGEDHAMTFLPQLIKSCDTTTFYGVGGERLQHLGVELLYHLKDFSGIGISEVLGKIPFYYSALNAILKEVKLRGTETAILIDFQGFNLKLAKKLKKMGVNVLYYVAPQAWVWKPWRAKVLECNVHTLFTILPFEKKWFEQRGVSKVRAVVHPLMLEYGQQLNELPAKTFPSERPIRVLLLPGSRNVEVSKLLPIFVRGIELIRENQFQIQLGIVKSESVRPEHYQVSLDFDQTWGASDLSEALKWADMAIAASGTVTLATGLFGVPTIVLYQVSLVTEFILNLLIPYKGPASLTNIVHQQPVFPELIQYQADRYGIFKYFKKWMSSRQDYQNVVNQLLHTKKLLTGEDFDVSEYMARVIKRDL